MDCWCDLANTDLICLNIRVCSVVNINYITHPKPRSLLGRLYFLMFCLCSSSGCCCYNNTAASAACLCTMCIIIYNKICKGRKEAVCSNKLWSQTFYTKVLSHSNRELNYQITIISGPKREFCKKTAHYLLKESHYVWISRIKTIKAVMILPPLKLHFGCCSSTASIVFAYVFEELYLITELGASLNFLVWW